MAHAAVSRGAGPRGRVRGARAWKRGHSRAWGSSLEAQVLRRYGGGEPDAVGADPELVAGAVHGSRVDAQHHGAAAAGADPGGGLAVGREVYVVPVHGLEAFGADRVQVPGDRAVEEVRGRGGRGQVELDRDRVALVGADPVAVDREPLLVVRGDHVVELGAGEAESVCGRRRDERVDADPAGRVEGEADALRLVPEMFREVLRDPHGSLFVHPVRVHGRNEFLNFLMELGMIHSQPRLSTG